MTAEGVENHEGEEDEEEEDAVNCSEVNMSRYM